MRKVGRSRPQLDRVSLTHQRGQRAPIPAPLSPPSKPNSSVTLLIRTVIAKETVFSEDASVTSDAYLWLGLAGLGAGFIDSVAGGGGMVTVPALMYAGLPMHLALGTNKLQSSFGTAVAVSRYWKAGLISKAQVQPAIFWTVASAIVGAWCVGTLDDSLLRKSVPILLIAIAAYMVVAPTLSP